MFANAGVFTPKKFFSIDRVFRNETLDATHLAEFHQVRCDAVASVVLRALRVRFGRVSQCVRVVDGCVCVCVCVCLHGRRGYDPLLVLLC